MADPDQQNTENDLRVPETFVKAMKDWGKERIFVPPSIDQTVLSKALQHLNRTRHRSFHALVPWTLAASIALAAWLVHTLPKLKSTPVDGNGAAGPAIVQKSRMDIFDAFALARRIERGPKPDPHWDINGDGVVDRHDVEAIAQEAVKLEKGRRS